MNFVRCDYFSGYMLRSRIFFNVFSVVFLSTYLIGCEGRLRLPSAEQVAEFENVGPSVPSMDMDRLMGAKMDSGPYRVVQGDVLELTMPAILQVVTAEQADFLNRVTPYVCRVGEMGTVTLPVIGDIEVVGKSLAEIESAVIRAYYPKYTVSRPLIAARVIEYRTVRVSIAGAVENPGIYELRSDQMSLVALLMEAGGIVNKGAASIRIINSGEAAAGIKKLTVERTPEQKSKEVIERIAEPSDIEALVYSPPYALPNETEVQLDPLGNLGLLIIRHEEAIILSDKLDINNAIQRQTVLEKLAKNEPRASTPKVGQRLCTLLASVLKPGSSMYSRTSQLADKTIGSNPEFSVSDPKHCSTSENTLYKQLAATSSGNLKRPNPIILPVKGFNIPFADVAIQDGDTVVVEQLEQLFFTIMGLVNKPGNFPYPPQAKYNLMQAFAFAGGLDKVAEPHYVTIYRLKADGTIVNNTLKIVEGSKLTNALNTIIKPGDIIDVAQTPRTRRKRFLDRVFNVNFGAYIPVFR